MAETPQSLPDRSKADAATTDGAAPSKNALKKAAKDAEKAAKKAAAKEREAQQKAQADTTDVSANDYGDVEFYGFGDKDGVENVQLEDFELRFGTKEEDKQTNDASSKIGFRAYLRNARGQSAKLAFLVVGVRLHSIQCVVAASDTLSRQMVKFASTIPAESCVLVQGLVTRPKDYVTSTTLGHLEVQITRLFVVARAETLPIQVEDCERPIPAEDGTEAAEKEKEDAGPEARPTVQLNTRLNNRTIDLRAAVNQAIFRIKHRVCMLYANFLDNKGFTQFQTPKLLGAASEGGSAFFEVSYFSRKAYLAQSPQLHKQMLIAAQAQSVFEIGPVFRAENSNTTRHLTEFTGLDLEMIIRENYHEVLDLLEELLLHIFNGLREKCNAETVLVRKCYAIEDFKLPTHGKTPRIHFSEGVAMLREAGAEQGDFDDLSTANEKLLGTLVEKKHGSDFYILDQYPLAVRPFYTHPSTIPVPGSEQKPAANAPEGIINSGYSNSYDFHMRGVEILSGAQRIHNHTLLVSRMAELSADKNPEKRIDPNSAGLKNYVDAFRYGCAPHGGAGLGLERIVALWLGLPNVRLASAFPRDPGRVLP